MARNAAATNSESTNSGRYDHFQRLSVRFFPFSETTPWHVKRIAIDIPPDQAAGIREKAARFKTQREFVLMSIEVEMATASK